MCCLFGVFDNLRVLKIIPVLHWRFVVFGVCSQTILRVLKIILVLHWWQCVLFVLSL